MASNPPLPALVATEGDKTGANRERLLRVSASKHRLVHTDPVVNERVQRLTALSQLPNSGITSNDVPKALQLTIEGVPGFETAHAFAKRPSLKGAGHEPVEFRKKTRFIYPTFDLSRVEDRRDLSPQDAENAQIFGALPDLGWTRFFVATFRAFEREVGEPATRLGPWLQGRGMTSQAWESHVRDIDVNWGAAFTYLNVRSLQGASATVQGSPGVVVTKCEMGHLCLGGDQSRDLHWDHLAYTGILRGIFCNNCNTRAISLFDEHPLHVLEGHFLHSHQLRAHPHPALVAVEASATTLGVKKERRRETSKTRHRNDLIASERLIADYDEQQPAPEVGQAGVGAAGVAQPSSDALTGAAVLAGVEAPHPAAGGLSALAGAAAAIADQPGAGTAPAGAQAEQEAAVRKCPICEDRRVEAADHSHLAGDLCIVVDELLHTGRRVDGRTRGSDTMMHGLIPGMWRETVVAAAENTPEKRSQAAAVRSAGPGHHSGYTCVEKNVRQLLNQYRALARGVIMPLSYSTPWPAACAAYVLGGPRSRQDFPSGPPIASPVVNGTVVNDLKTKASSDEMEAFIRYRLVTLLHRNRQTFTKEERTALADTVDDSLVQCVVGMVTSCLDDAFKRLCDRKWPVENAEDWPEEPSTGHPAAAGAAGVGTRSKRKRASAHTATVKRTVFWYEELYKETRYARAKLVTGLYSPVCDRCNKTTLWMVDKLRSSTPDLNADAEEAHKQTWPRVKRMHDFIMRRSTNDKDKW